MKEIKVSDYIQFVKPTYVYLKLIPNNSIKNNNTDGIAKAIASLYTTIWEQIEIEEQKLVQFFGREWILGTKYKVNQSAKVTYYVYMEKDKVEFYFILPKQHVTILKERIKNSWNNLTIEEVSEVPLLDQATNYQMLYKYEDGVSVAVDRRDNALLNSNLNILNTLEETDRVALIYNFIPTSQYSWNSIYRETLQRIKNQQSIEKNKASLIHGLNVFVDAVNSFFKSISDLFSDKKVLERSQQQSLLDLTLSRIENKQTISQATANKRTSPILKTQIIVQSQSDDRLRQFSNAKSLCNSFDVITEDNALIPSRVKKTVNLHDYSMSEKYNLMSSDECMNFIALPGRSLLNEYKIIEKVETHTTDIPDDLQQGVMCIGTVTHQGVSKKAYLSTDKEYQHLSLVVIGPTRAGKSYFLTNIMADAINNGECSIIFDFCGNCELSDDISSKVAKGKILNIDCSDLSNLQGFAYNEVPKADDELEQYRNAKEQSVQLMTLLNACNDDAKALAPRMERFLLSASLVVFLNGGAIKDVFEVLQVPAKRQRFIDAIPANQLERMEEYITTLNELNDMKNGEVVGNKTDKVSGILDRLNKLKINTYTELMLKKGGEDNINLVDEIQKNQLICLRMPDSMFATDQERDVYCLYWLSKIWLALQIRKWQVDRKDHVKVNVVIDELYQVNNTEAFLTEKLSRLAKYSAKPILSCHYINQLKIIRDELRSANCSYMLVSGCDAKNYDELKSELQPFAEEDLLKLPKYHSLNYIK
ncbi:MAG: hypothetical protein K2G70_05935, partial [Turicibacter sp.]|nr:hypothetical protein [Turicibacter sp.]